MSNSLAIAAVTATLRNLLTQGLTADLPGTVITTMAPDIARQGNGKVNQVNLFLYQTGLNGAWRNKDVPGQAMPGETGQPPLALNLFYLVTAYGQDDNDAFSHRLLGRTMSILYDHPLLGRDEIKAALSNNDLHEQVERVRITAEPLSLEEMSKLWTTFQTQYRISAAYQVSVVLIESTRPTKTPLPVLTRGPVDKGVTVVVNLIPPFPTIETVHPPNQQPSARLGEVLTITGHHLGGDTVVVRFTTPRVADALDVAAQPGGTASEMRVQLPNEPAKWPAGFYTLAAVVRRSGEPDRTTNQLPFSLAPQITTPPPISVARNPNGDVTLTLKCSPDVRPEQRATFLLSDREILAQPHPAQTDTLSFVITAAPPGDHFVRLRVDGVDSLLVDRTTTPPSFDQTQKVTIT